MTEINILLRWFSIDYSCFKGYTAPDETVGEESVEEVLYSREKASWQPVQVGIPSGITSIGHNAFEACEGLVGVTIPDTVVSIGRAAFLNCTSLTRVRIPGSVREIQDTAFSMCTALTNLIIPDGVQRIGEGAFFGCKGLTQAILPESVERLGHGAFYRCFGLQEIALPEAVCGRICGSFGDQCQLLWKRLTGKVRINASAAARLAEDVHNTHTGVIQKIVSRGDLDLLERYLNLWDRMPLEYLDRLIVRRRPKGRRTQRGCCGIRESGIRRGLRPGKVVEDGRRGERQGTVPHLL